MPKKATEPNSEASQSQSNPEVKLDPIHITTHRHLASGAAEINKRFNANPDFASLLLVNPVMAFKEVGVTVSPEIASHILHTIQFSSSVQKRHDELQKKIADAIGETPRATDPEWLSHFLFEDLKLKPLVTDGQTPAYTPIISAETVAKLELLRPASRRGKGGPDAPNGAIRIDGHPPSLWQLDLDAPAPKLKTADSIPTELDLPTLFFYKDSDPLVREVLELGIIEKNALSIQSAATYRDVKDGKKAFALGAWIKTIRFPEAQDESDL